MELVCTRGKWRIFLAAVVIIFGSQMALVFSYECPTNDTKWIFQTKPDRCILSIRYDQNVHKESEFPMSEVRKKCQKLATGFYIVDLMSLPDMEAFNSFCSLMPAGFALGLGLVKQPTETDKDYYWVATREKVSKSLPWRSKAISNENFNCTNFVKGRDSKCVLVPADCRNSARFHMCSTYHLNPCDEGNGNCPSGKLCRYVGPMARECICPKNSTYMQARQKCECSVGFVRKVDPGNDTNTYCEDINECNDSDNVCGKSCVNTVGGYHCNCTGENMVQELIHTPNRGPCVCEKSFKLSDDGSTCACGYRETVRDGHCVCDNGFLHTTIGCRDINECANIVQKKCGERCVNTIGSYLCECTGPYFARGKHADNNPQCVCEEGYHLNEKADSCIDYDECSNTNTTLCAVGQYCLNTEGNYTCCGEGSNGNANDDELCKTRTVATMKPAIAAAAKSETGNDKGSNKFDSGFGIGIFFLVVGVAFVSLYVFNWANPPNGNVEELEQR